MNHIDPYSNNCCGILKYNLQRAAEGTKYSNSALIKNVLQVNRTWTRLITYLHKTDSTVKPVKDSISGEKKCLSHMKAEEVVHIETDKSISVPILFVPPHACVNWSDWSRHGHMTWYIFTVSLLQLTIPLATKYCTLSDQRPNQRPDQRHERHAFNYVLAHNLVNSTPIIILILSADNWQNFLWVHTKIIVLW